ncbi:proton-coupled amino acid transporter-like protein CG1139 [Amyelois transitella]|uniref:proton-coupled amino acid transporter-like protein CG1139 n=1 Tax=Amyelois transitella TaxID=680683 RepID=UPI00067C1C99|nr:proton-coupled amino acid transporter-like protein CG1139 [Amyelois transitella]
MFIYQFMAGVVETISGEDEEGKIEFDPHKHRKIVHPTSYSDTMIHLLKGSIGAGILAMPEAVRRVGIPASCGGILLIGTFATYCIQLLIAAQYLLCQRQRRGYMTYPRSMFIAVSEGPPLMRKCAYFFYYFVDTVLIMWQLGICTIYAVFVAENLKQVFDFYGVTITLRLHLCYLLVPLIIINLVKDLKLMTPLSTISNVVTIFALILVFFYLVEDDVEVDSSMLEIKTALDIPAFVGTTLFALEAVGVVLALEYNMENPKQFVGLFGLFNIGMVIIMALYLIVGLFGYLKYGDDIQASITLNLPQVEKKAQAAKIMIAIAIFLSFPLQNFVAYVILFRKMKKKLSSGPHTLKTLDYLLRIALVLTPWSLAVIVPSLGPFIALFGALCLSLLAMVFPALMDLCVWYPKSYGVLRYKLIRDLIIIVLGLFCCISGCYTSVLEIIHTFG